MSGVTASDYLIFGHSAGAQFVHRLCIFKARARIRKAVCANAGWYVGVDFNTRFPHGLRDSPATPESIALAVSKEMVILLGDKDVDPSHAIPPPVDLLAPSPLRNPAPFSRLISPEKTPMVAA